jgi:hypothetical protein
MTEGLYYEPESPGEAENIWGTADSIGFILIRYHDSLTKAERTVLEGAVDTLMRFGGKVSRGE